MPTRRPHANPKNRACLRRNGPLHSCICQLVPPTLRPPLVPCGSIRCWATQSVFHRTNAMTISQRAVCLAGVASAASLLAACAGSRGGAHVRSTWSSATYVRDFSLSRTARTDSSSGVTLVRVRPDGAATIRISATSGMLTVRPGAYYVCEEFGQHGLQLISSSPTTGTAIFQRARAQ